MDYQPSTEFGMAKAMIPEHVQMFESDVNETTTNNFQTIQITTTPNLIQKNSLLVNSVRPLSHKSGNNSINKSAEQGIFLLVFIAILRNKLFVLASLFMFNKILKNLSPTTHSMKYTFQKF